MERLFLQIRVSSDKLNPEADLDCHFRERALEQQL